MYRLPHYDKAISRTKLIEILTALPDGATHVAPNAVGNLAVTNLQGDYLGYIEIGSEEVTLFPSP